MNVRPNILKSLALVSLLLPHFLLADEDHVTIRTRPSKQVNTEESVNYAREEAQCGYIFDRPPAIILHSTLHYFKKFTTSSLTSIDEGELEDGSVWKFNPYDGYKASNWVVDNRPEELDLPEFDRPLDPHITYVTITQNFSWFSNYTYRIINKDTGESIEANLKLGPLKDSRRSRFITAIDPNNRVIILNDNSRYEISRSDVSAFRDWALFDYIIKGQNGGWSSSYEVLLINVNMDNYVHAKEI